MEWPSFAGQHGVLMRLPPGFRFHPTDEELVVEYLRRKVLRCPLPAAVIPEINLGKHVDPWDLPGESHGERYFFMPGEAKRPANGGRSSNSRATCSGYWKPAGKDIPVMASSHRNTVVGVKKVLVFHRGKHPRGSPTDWIMHEYRLVAAAATRAGEVTAPAGFATRKKSLHEYGMPKQQSCTDPTEDWVVCRIFRKRSKQTESHGSRLHNDAAGAALIGREGTAAAAARPSSSSGSSCITDDASEEGDGCSSDDVASSPCAEHGLKM